MHPARRDPIDLPPGGDLFPSTRWSMLGRPAAGGTRAPDLDALARSYWTPIHAWLRARHTDEVDARDATQEFFAWLIESRAIEQVDPARGRFRAFLKTALRSYAIDRDRRRRAAKRGGGRAAAPLDGDEPHASADPAPDAALDAAWRAEMVERTLKRLEVEMCGSGHETRWLVFRDYFLAPDPGIDHATLARRHGVDAIAVSNHLRHAKVRLRALLREAVRDTVSSQGDLDSELRWLVDEDPA
ncbi:MAG TPA: sigma factor [Planctomycetota bacterium]|nr:sigma factor [Planctomycetota bacterium]